MTSYQIVFDKFIKKLKGDTFFFNYGDLPDDEINNRVERHLLTLLEGAIDRLYAYGLPDIDFYDRNDENKTFSEELTPQEISLLADLMYLIYAEEDLNRLKAMGLILRTSEINAFSPAHERRSYLDMLRELTKKVEHSIDQYFARDRKTWKLKSLYGEPL